MSEERKRIVIEDRRSAAADADGASPAELAAHGAAGSFPANDADGTGRGPAARQSGSEPDWAAKAAEHLELAQRKEAELRNYMKRVQQDISDARRFAVEGVLADLFPVLDGLAHALENYKDKPAGDPLLDGLRGTFRGLRSALAKHGIEPIGEVGAPYDSHLHQALHVEDGDVDHDTVSEVYTEGYKLGEHVLKPAMVKVLKPRE